MRPPPARTQLLDEPVHDTTLLLFHLKRLLPPLLAEIGRVGQAVDRLSLRLGLGRGAGHPRQTRPGGPPLHDGGRDGANRRHERVRRRAGSGTASPPPA